MKRHNEEEECAKIIATGEPGAKMQFVLYGPGFDEMVLEFDSPITVDWGDGNTEVFSVSGDPITHTYVGSGNKTVKVYCAGGNITAFDIGFDGGVLNSNKLISISVLPNSLTYIDVSGNAALVSLDLTGLSVLEELYCQNCALDTLGLSGCDSLIKLNLSGNAFGEDFSFLEEVRDTLTHLWLMNCAHIPNLEEYPAIEYLNLSYCTVTDNYSGLGESCPTIKTLIANSASVTGKVGLWNHPAIEEYDFSNTAITKFQIQSSMPFKILRLDGCTSITEYPDFTINSSMEELYINSVPCSGFIDCSGTSLRIISANNSPGLESVVVIEITEEVYMDNCPLSFDTDFFFNTALKRVSGQNNVLWSNIGAMYLGNKPALVFVDLTGCNYDVSEVDDIILAVQSNGNNNGTLNLMQAPPAIPTQTATIAVLESRGWTVQVDS